MDQRQQERLGAATGIGFVVLAVASFVFGPTDKPPGFDDSAQEVASFIGDNRDKIQVLSALTLLSAPLFLWFLGSLARTLRLAEERGPGRLAAVSFAGGIVAVTLAILGTALQLAASQSDLDPSAVRVLWYGGAMTFAFALGVGITTFVGAASVLGLRSGALPGWLAGAGVVLALFALVVGTVATFQETGAFSAANGEVGLCAFLLFLLWTLATSICLVRAAGRATE